MNAGGEPIPVRPFASECYFTRYRFKEIPMACSPHAWKSRMASLVVLIFLLTIGQAQAAIVINKIRPWAGPTGLEIQKICARTELVF